MAVIQITRDEYQRLIEAQCKLDILAENWYKPDAEKLALLNNILDTVRKNTEENDA